MTIGLSAFLTTTTAVQEREEVLASLLTALSACGLITDSTMA